MEEKVTIYSVHSQKGGVGKSSIALAIAGWASYEKKHKSLVIDCDLTGSSLIDLFGNSHKESKKTRDYFLNDLFLSQPFDFEKYGDDIDKLFFLPFPSCEDAFYIPSSPIRNEIKKIAGLISQEEKLHYFQSRMEDIIQQCKIKGVKDIVIDNPPGLFGLSSAMLNLQLSDDYKRKIILATSPEPMDYKAMFPSFASYRIEKNVRDINEHYFFVNKVSAKQWRDPIFVWQSIFDNLIKEDAFPDFARTNDAKIIKDTVEDIKKRIEKEGAGSLPFIEEFDSCDIIRTIGNITHSKVIPETGLSKWCLSIKESLFR